MMTPILVTGGTGTLGRLVVARLRTAGHPVRVVSRGDPRDEDGLRVVTGDLATGAGIAAAVAGVNTIVHCASSAKGDVESTRNLVHAASRTGDEPHLVYVSIVGADRLPYGYMRTKLECERLVAESGLPWTLLRATQFYDLILTGAKRVAKLPFVPVPAGLLCQPVDPADVAARLVELALGAPAGRVPDLAGPRQWEAAELIREYLRATGRRRPVVPVLLPGTGRIRAGALLATGQPTTGHRTWEEFLASRLS
ncbi:MAG TPA: SDR family oxidoreductase [Actinocatenispora sp.]